MVEDAELGTWRALHRRALEVRREAEAHIDVPDAPTPCGTWTAQQVIAHLREEHGVDGTPPEADVATLRMLTLDLAVHSWDLARSQGCAPQIDDELAIALHEAFAPYTHLMVQDDAFAPSVPSPPGTTRGDRLAALCGRDPEWRGGTAPR